MGDILKWAAEQEKQEYKDKHGDRDRQADHKLHVLRLMRSELFTVYELMFLIDPFDMFLSSFATRTWNEDTVTRLNVIYDRILTKYPVALVTAEHLAKG